MCQDVFRTSSEGMSHETENPVSWCAPVPVNCPESALKIIPLVFLPHDVFIFPFPGWFLISHHTVIQIIKSFRRFFLMASQADTHFKGMHRKADMIMKEPETQNEMLYESVQSYNFPVNM